jgi:hypothetical protein
MSSPMMTNADRLRSAMSAFVRALDPTRSFFGQYEYRVANQAGNLIDCVPVDSSLGLPSLTGVIMRPSIRGDTSTLPNGTSVLVAFVNGDPTRPFVAGADPNNVPQTVTDAPSNTWTVKAGGMADTEHIATVEGVVNMLVNFLYLIKNSGDPSTWSSSGKILDPLSFPTVLLAQLTTWLGSCATLIPPTAVLGGGQLLPGLYTLINTTINAKIANSGGSIPNIGAPKMKGG